MEQRNSAQVIEERWRLAAEALAEFAHAAAGAGDVPQILSLLAEQALALVGGAACGVFVYEGKAQHLVLAHARGLDGRFGGQGPVPLGRGVVGRALATRAPAISTDGAGLPADLAGLPADQAGSPAGPDAEFSAALAVPILVRGEPFGALALYRDEPAGFADPDVRLLTLVGAHAGIALERAQVQAEAKRKREEAEALQALTRLISSTLDPAEIFRALVERTCQALGTSRCSLWEIREEGGELRIHVLHGVGLSQEFTAALQIRLGEGTTGACLQRRTPVWTADILADPALQLSETTRRLVQAEGYRAVCSAPVLLPDGPFGVLTIYRDTPHAFSEREVALLSAFADQAAVALANARLFRQEQERRRQVEAVRAVVEEITRELDLPRLLALIQRRAQELAGAAAAVICLWDEAAGVLVPRIWSGHDDWMGEVRIRLGEGLSGIVAERREGLIVNDYRSWPGASRAILERTPVTAALAEPLLYRDRLLGVITLDNQGTGRPFTEQDRQFLALLAAHAAIAIENARLFDRLRETAAVAGRQRARAEAMAAVGQAVAASLDLTEVFELVVERAAGAIGAHAAAFLEPDTATGALRVRRAHGLPPADQEALVIPFEEGIQGHVLETAQAQWTVHVLMDPRFSVPAPVRALAGAQGIRGILSVPIRGSEETFGILDLYWKGMHLFEDEEIAFGLRIAEQVAIAIENARLLHQEQERGRQVEAARAVSAEILRELDLPTLLRLIQRRAVELTGAGGAVLCLWDEEGQALVPQAWYGYGDWMAAMRLRLGQDLAGVVAESREGLLVNDYRTWPQAHPVILERCQTTAALAEPLLYRDRLLGVLTVDNQGTGRLFTEQDQETLALFAAQAAIAIENARLYQAERSRTRDLAALIQAGRSVTSSLDLTQILGAIVTSAMEITGASLVNLLLLQEGSPLVWQACSDALQGAIARSGDEVPLHVGKTFAEMVAARRESLWVRDTAADPLGRDADFTERHGLRRYLGVPLLAGERVLGVLSVLGPAGGSVHEGARELLESLAAQASLAIENARLFTQTREAFEELAAIQEAGQAIAQSLDLQETLQRILSAAMRLTATDQGTIWMLDEEGQALVGACTVGSGPDPMPPLPLSEPSLASICLREGRVLVSESPGDDPRIHPGLQARFRNQAVIAVPLRSGTRVIGVLMIGDLKRPRQFGARETAILERLAQQAVVAIENARLFGQVLRSQSEWEHTFDSISDLVAVVDLEGRIVRANRALLRRLNLPAGQVLRRTCRDVFGEDEPAWGGCPHRRALNLGTRVALEVDDPRLGGSYSVGVFPVRDADGRVVGTVHIARDVTEQKTIQTKLFQADKLAALGTLAAGVAHNINNVMAAIVARADLVLLSSQESETRRSAEVIQQAAMDGAETVRRLQEFAKIKTATGNVPVDVNQVARDALELTAARWRDEAQARGAAIRVETSLEATARLDGNPAEIREVMVNLVLNAADAMPKGGLLRITTRNKAGRPAAGAGRRPAPAEPAAGSLEVRVEDSGLGMSDAVRRRIFDPFFTTKGVSGTGLGLSVSYGLVTKHGGDIAVHSREGEGTTFVLTFPAAGKGASAPAAPRPAAAPRSGRVLLIDDEAMLREAMAEALGMAGHQVQVMAGGREALQRFRPGDFDVVLTDLGMPEVSGLDVARAVKQADPSVYVILCTGWGNITGAEEPLRDRGVDALLPKPFRVSDAVAAVQMGLETRDAATPAPQPAA